MQAQRTGQVIGAGLAAAWLVFAVVLDIVAPSSTIFSPFFAVAPLIASAVLPAFVTGGFAAVAVAAAVAAGWWDDTWGTEQQVVRIIDVVLVSGMAVAVAAFRVRREQRFERMVAIADVAQRAILPTVPPTVGPVAVAARYLSAAEDAFVGGDLYDYYHSESRTRFLVGDVRGKGLGAVEQAARVIRAFRQSASSVPSLAEVAVEMDAYLKPFMDDEEFVTALLVDVSDPRRVTVVSCGHPPPLLVTANGQGTYVVAPAGLPLGLGQTYSATTTSWAAGERLLMYTDGLSEARDAHGVFLSPLELAPAVTSDTVEDALDEVLDGVRHHVPRGRLTDDLAILLLENVTARPGEPARDAQSDEHTASAPGVPA